VDMIQLSIGIGSTPEGVNPETSASNNKPIGINTLYIAL